MIDIPINVYGSGRWLSERKGEVGSSNANNICSSVAVDLQVVGLDANDWFAEDKADLHQIGNGAANGWGDT